MSRFLKTLLATTLFAQVAVAQDTDKKTEVNVKTEQTVTLSPREMQSQAEQYKGEIASGVTQIDQMVTRAKDDRDVIKLNCLNDKLVQANANQNLVDKASVELEQAVTQNDSGAAMHKYTSITIVNQKMQVLLAESNECVGEELGHVGNQTNSTLVANTVRTDQVTNPTPPILVGNVKPGQPVNPDTTPRPPIPSPYL